MSQEAIIVFPLVVCAVLAGFLLWKGGTLAKHGEGNVRGRTRWIYVKGTSAYVLAGVYMLSGLLLISIGIIFALVHLF